jgi:hypothetical protein
VRPPPSPPENPPGETPEPPDEPPPLDEPLSELPPPLEPELTVPPENVGVVDVVVPVFGFAVRGCAAASAAGRIRV